MELLLILSTFMLTGATTACTFVTYYVVREEDRAILKAHLHPRIVVFAARVRVRRVQEA